MQNTPLKTEEKNTTKRMVTVALTTAVTCILAPLSIPIPVSPVPITLTNLVLFISVFILNWKDALLSYVVYLLIGLAGLPVFSGFSGGIGRNLPLRNRMACCPDENTLYSRPVHRRTSLPLRRRYKNNPRRRRRSYPAKPPQQYPLNCGC